jgi:hypothetical protein
MLDGDHQAQTAGRKRHRGGGGGRRIPAHVESQRQPEPSRARRRAHASVRRIHRTVHQWPPDESREGRHPRHDRAPPGKLPRWGTPRPSGDLPCRQARGRRQRPPAR